MGICNGHCYLNNKAKCIETQVLCPIRIYAKSKRGIIYYLNSWNKIQGNYNQTIPFSNNLKYEVFDLLIIVKSHYRWQMPFPSQWRVSTFTLHIIGKEIQIFKIELTRGKASVLQLSTKCFFLEHQML